MIDVVDRVFEIAVQTAQPEAILQQAIQRIPYVTASALENYSGQVFNQHSLMGAITNIRFDSRIRQISGENNENFTFVYSVCKPGFVIDRVEIMQANQCKPLSAPLLPVLLEAIHEYTEIKTILSQMQFKSFEKVTIAFDPVLRQIFYVVYANTAAWSHINPSHRHMLNRTTVEARLLYWNYGGSRNLSYHCDVNGDNTSLNTEKFWRTWQGFSQDDFVNKNLLAKVYIPDSQTVESVLNIWK